ncbi:Ger(x)C family spore germination protein [Paenibacillus sp. FSL W7-1287]|uniref:Ger(x)C family spore germination protein n=2 Tax=Paenibacillus TaxID=44249 RepID=UPI0030FAAE10|nr:Ger(x)C family spore germination protein [Paenibacillus camelliae]
MMLLVMLLLIGCGDQRVLEKLGFTQTTSYDLDPNTEESSDDEKQGQQKLLISVTIPRTRTENSRELITATAYTSKEAKIKLSSQTELTIVSGQLRNTLFGLSLAKQGIWEHIDTLVRDSSISPRVKVTIVNGSAHELLSKDYSQHNRTGKYLDRMLEKEAISQTVPEITLYRFTRDFLDDGIDAVAPIIKQLDEHVSIDGIALFQGDRYVTKVEPDDTLIFAFLRGRFKNGEMSVDMSEVGRINEHIMFSSMISKRKIKIKTTSEGQHYHADISINVRGSVLEYTGKLSLDNVEHQKQIEKLIAEYIKLKTEEMVAMMQKNNVDSIGLGKYVRNKLSYEEWKNLDWRRIYPNIEVTCNVNVRIKDFGKFVNIEQ